MNYIVSFLICIALTTMTALTTSHNTYWLMVSDVNVLIFLSLAAILERKFRR